MTQTILRWPRSGRALSRRTNRRSSPRSLGKCARPDRLRVFRHRTSDPEPRTMTTHRIHQAILVGLVLGTLFCITAVRLL